MVKKKLIPILFLSFMLINNPNIHAEDFSNPAMGGTQSLNDFSMDMMMDQSHMAIEAGNEGISDAEETNTMNHELDNSMNLFLEDNPFDSTQTLDSNPSEIADALQNGNWTDSFNDYFDSNSGETNSDINFFNMDNQSPNDSNANDISNDMPQLEFANDESVSSLSSSDNQIDDNLTGLLDNTTVIVNDDSLGNNMSADDTTNDDSLSSFDVSTELPDAPEAQTDNASNNDNSDNKDDTSLLSDAADNTPISSNQDDTN